MWLFYPPLYAYQNFDYSLIIDSYCTAIKLSNFEDFSKDVGGEFVTIWVGRLEYGGRGSPN